MTALPPPLVPAELDLRRLWWMKLDIGRLINSEFNTLTCDCLLYTSPSPRDGLLSRMPSSA